MPRNGEAIKNADDDDIPCFVVDTPEDLEWPDDWEQDADFDKLLVSSETADSRLPGRLVPVTMEEIIREQFGDPFYMKIWASLNAGEDLLFEVNDVVYLVRTVESTPQGVVSHSLQ